MLECCDVRQQPWLGMSPKQAAPLPDLAVALLFTSAEVQVVLDLPSLLEASFSQLLLSPGESQRRQTSLSVQLDYATGQERARR